MVEVNEGHMELRQLLGIDQATYDLAYFKQKLFSALQVPPSMLRQFKEIEDVVIVKLEHQPDMPGIRIGSLWLYHDPVGHDTTFIFLGFDVDGKAWIFGPRGPGSMDGSNFQNIIREGYITLLSEECEDG